MSRRFWIPALLVIAILSASAGLMRLRFDTDILSMLPDELPEVKGLKAFHEAFSRNDEMIVLIEGGEADEGSLGAAAESLGRKLQADGLVKKARWQPSWMSEPDGLTDLLAYLWLNGDPAGVPFGSDASKLSRQGVPSLVFGPGSIDRAHGAVEYVEIDEVVKAKAFFREFLKRFE